MNKFYFIITTLCLLCISMTSMADDTSQTWSYSFYRTATNGGEGFSGSESKMTTTINGVAWSIESDVSKYSIYANQGQVIGSSTDKPSYAIMSTTGLPGKIKSVALKAKAFTDCTVELSVKVNGINYLANNADKAVVPTAATDTVNFITFVPTEEQEGKIEIRFDQTSDKKLPIYIKRIDIVYDNGGMEIIQVTPPTFSPLGGYSMSPKTITLTPNNPEDIIYYTLDESEPTSSGTRIVYSEPFTVENTTTVSAVAFRQETYSTVSKQKYFILHDPQLHFEDYTSNYEATIGDVGIFVKPHNPFNLPLYFESSDKNVATVDNNGTVHALAAGTSEISFYFDGDDDYIGGEGHYLLTVVESKPLAAIFSAEETQEAYYSMGWDTEEEAATWDYSRENEGIYSWHLNNTPPYSGQPEFSSIDPNSKYSLCVRRGSKEQNEFAVSPKIKIQPNSTLEFYACFQSIFLVYDDWKMYIIDEDNENVAYTLSAFTWSQQNEFTGPAWQKFSIDLSSFAGMNASFAFQYIGPDGEDLAIDGFKLLKPSDDAEGNITINEGEKVHFIDNSTGNPTAWHWTFEGGEPAESTEQNPVVTYKNGGVYDVTLIVTDDNNESASTTITGYVNVVTQAPRAMIGMPTEGYLSPWAALFVAPNVPVQYHDNSTGNPTAWYWTFDGGTPAESTEQNPIVTYNEEGKYGLTLEVSNSSGTTNDFMKDAIQVGGTQYVWNIELDEYDMFNEIALGFYGFYGGSNWLGMEKFAERYDAPAAPVDIDKVQVYFYNTSTVTPGADITVQLCAEGSDGNPGEVLAETSVKADNLAYDPNTVVATDFNFASPVTLDKPFFVVIGPFPHNSAGSSSDNISIMAVRRNEGGKTTTWHLLEDEDPVTYAPLGTYTWYKNVDDAVSFCITPQLTYKSSSGIESAEMTSEQHADKVFDLQGRRIGTQNKQLQRGIYIVNGKKVVRR